MRKPTLLEILSGIAAIVLWVAVAILSANSW